MGAFGLGLSLILAFAIASTDAVADPIDLSLKQEIVSTASRASFAPNDLSTRDFEIVGSNDSVQAYFIENSFEWMKTSQLHFLPRSRILFSSKSDPRAKLLIEYLGAISWNEVEVALVSSIVPEIVVRDAGTRAELTRFSIHFKPRAGNLNRVVIDHHCSNYSVQVDAIRLTTSWIEVSCRVIQSQSSWGTRPVLELHVFWDGGEAGQSIAVDHFLLSHAEDSALVTIAVTSKEKELHLQRGSEEVTLTHEMPALFHKLVLSAGVGPYLYRLQEGGAESQKWVPFGTLYLSYVLSDSLKLASFWAFPVATRFQTDVGLYLITEQFRILDSRVSMNLLLGAHALEFSGSDKNHVAFSAPQGVEINFRDFGGVRRSLSVGGFFYPAISGRSYVNSWVRYNTSFLFYELNYISWIEPFDGVSVNSRSMGLSVGFPLFKAL